MFISARLAGYDPPRKETRRRRCRTLQLRVNHPSPSGLPPRPGLLRLRGDWSWAPSLIGIHSRGFRDPPRTGLRSALTLIELLAVIAVIGVLIALLLFGDGSVRFIKDFDSTTTLGALASRNGGEAVSSDAY